MDKKKVVSQVLKEQRNWIESEKELPNDTRAVVIRLCHRTALSGETDNEAYPLEDIKVAKYVDRCWVILPPHPKYDYSPLSKQCDILKDVDATHWAELENGELIGWTTRLDRIGKYAKLELRVDPENEPHVYRALTYGAAYINQYGTPDIKPLAKILYDLQHCIDFDNASAPGATLEELAPNYAKTLAAESEENKKSSTEEE